MDSTKGEGIMEKRLSSQIIGIILTVVFIVFCYLIKVRPDFFSGFDNYFIEMIKHNLYPQFNLFFITVTRLGDFIFVLPLSIICFALLFMYKKKREAIWLLSGVGIVAGGFVHFLKTIIGRQRPDSLHLVVVHGLSFPSGHATVSILLYGMLIVLINRHIKRVFIRRALQVVLSMLIICIGLSRIYCGVHFPTDVMGGFLLGLIWLHFTHPIFIKN
ncbi:phosphatase PAP2 family protein [Spirochaetia bacterium]|nr:phosphatase PAP2 family protein [Spirochaetia bacterium]